VAHTTPLYVTGIDPERNRLIVGDDSDLLAEGLLMRQVNYVALGDLPEQGMKLRAKIRYGAEPVDCMAWKEGDGVALRFTRPQRAITPGQAVVCYDKDAVAFGGVIEAGLQGRKGCL
jgi:tRNA-specific 2-thiouridylase